MSLKINPKDIINKQKDKYKDSPWGEFLLQEFGKEDFEKLLSKLISNVEQGNPFMPPIKNWFDDLMQTPLSNLNVVVISKDNSYLDKFGSTFKPVDELKREGVLFYPLSRTTIKNDKLMLEEWRMFNIYFMDYLISKAERIVYVFIGFDAAEYSDLITDDMHGYKIFLPETTSNVWTSKDLYKVFTNSVNRLLDNANKPEINW